MAAPVSSDEKVLGHHETISGGKDEDSSSGNVDAIEKAGAPSATLMVVDKATERAVLRKLDYRIVPMVMWVYLMNMMDRGKLLFSWFAKPLGPAVLTTCAIQSTSATLACSAWRRILV